MSKRLYPKCFKSNLHAVSFYDLISEKHPDSKNEKQFVLLCKHYTSLLCGMHFLNNGGALEKLRQRFQRFLLLHYYPNCSWELILRTYQHRVQQLSGELQEIIGGEEAVATHQKELLSDILQFFEPLLRTEN
jgi:hypothetical protein